MARKNKGYSKRRKPYDAYKDWLKKLSKTGRIMEKALTEEQFDSKYISIQKKNAIAKKKGQDKKVVRNIARALAYNAYVFSRDDEKEIRSREVQERIDLAKMKGQKVDLDEIKDKVEEDVKKWGEDMVWTNDDGELVVAQSKRQSIYVNLVLHGATRGAVGFKDADGAIY